MTDAVTFADAVSSAQADARRAYSFYVTCADSRQTPATVVWAQECSARASAIARVLLMTLLDRRAPVAASEHLNAMAADVHKANAKWWRYPATGQPIARNRGEMLMLIVSEIAEAMEGERKSLPDDKLPHRPMAEVELADALIRIFDYAAGHGYDLGGAYVEKMAYNATRKDHTDAERLKANGKRW